MLHTNLSTRPFYNVRAVQVTLVALAVLVVLMTLVNLYQFVRLTGSERALGARATESEAEAGRLRGEASRVRGQINPRELNKVAAEAQEANAVIDLRAFSWTDLFAHLEATMPEGVRLTSLQPRVEEDGRFVVQARVQARGVLDIEAFLEALEKTTAFHDVLASEEQVNDEGLIDATVQGVYTPATAAAAPPAGADGAGAKGRAGE